MPQPIDPPDRNAAIRRSIEQSINGTPGWQVICETTGGEQRTSYTVGLYSRLRHPELFVAGLDHDNAIALLNGLGRMIQKRGIGFEPGVRYYDIIEDGRPIMFRPLVGRQERSIAEIAWIDGYYKWPVPAWQVYIADNQGRFPWEDGHISFHSGSQAFVSAGAAADTGHIARLDEYGRDKYMDSPRTPYADKLSPEDQIDAEETVAAIVFNYEYADPDTRPSEDAAAEIGRRATRAILRRFRPDFFESPSGT